MVHRAQLEYARDKPEHMLVVPAGDVRGQFRGARHPQPIAHDAQQQVKSPEQIREQLRRRNRPFQTEIKRRRPGNKVDDVVRQRKMRPQQIGQNKPRESEKQEHGPHDHRDRLSHIYALQSLLLERPEVYTKPPCADSTKSYKSPEAAGGRFYLIPTSSTIKISVASGGIKPFPAPRAP